MTAIIPKCLGYAYRPVQHHRLNALLKYTYFYTVPAADQATGTDAAADFIQRSHIGSVDVMYDLTSRWHVWGQVRLPSRAGGPGSGEPGVFRTVAQHIKMGATVEELRIHPILGHLAVAVGVLAPHGPTRGQVIHDIHRSDVAALDKIGRCIGAGHLIGRRHIVESRYT